MGNHSLVNIAMTDVRQGKSGAYDRLEVLANSNPAEVSQAIRGYVLAVDVNNHIDDAPFFISELARINGFAAVADWIRGIWPYCEQLARDKVCYWAHAHDGMPTELAIELFSHPKSSVRERHWLAAGLALTAKVRHAESIVLELLPRIGTYDDRIQQESLDEFVQDVRRSFG